MKPLTQLLGGPYRPVSLLNMTGKVIDKTVSNSF